MSFDSNPPDAQGTNADSQNQAQPVPVEQHQPPEAGPGNGIQKRFDELTARLYAKDETIDRLTSQMTELASRLSQVPAQAPVAAPQQEDFGDVDPGMKRMMDSFMRQMDQKYGSVVAQLGQTVYQSEAARAAQTMGVQDVQVAQRAQELASKWRGQGLPFVPEDAVKYALGEKAVRDAQSMNSRGRDAQGRFAGNPGMNGANPPPNFAPQVPANQRPLPPNYDHLSHDEQIRLLAQRGVDDIPI